MPIVRGRSRAEGISYWCSMMIISDHSRQCKLAKEIIRYRAICPDHRSVTKLVNSCENIDGYEGNVATGVDRPAETWWVKPKVKCNIK